MSGMGIKNNGWLAESLRFTAFFSDDLVDDYATRDWYRGLDLEEPDEEIHIRKEYQKKFSFKKDQSLLQLVVTPERLDVFLSSDPEILITERHLLGDVEVALDSFCKKILPWIQELDVGINRIALGAVCLAFQESRDSAYRFLNDMLPKIDLSPDEGMEFSFGINRPRNSIVLKKQKINRHTQWSALRLRSLNITKGSKRDIDAARLVLDINTSKDNEISISPSDRAGLLDELRILLIEITKEGDIS